MGIYNLHQWLRNQLPGWQHEIEWDAFQPFTWTSKPGQIKAKGTMALRDSDGSTKGYVNFSALLQFTGTGQLRVEKVQLHGKRSHQLNRWWGGGLEGEIFSHIEWELTAHA